VADEESALEATFKQLVDLEAICAEIDRLDACLAEFPGEEAVVAAGIRDAKAALEAARAALEHEELEERRLEAAMKDQEALILKLNHQSAQVASNEAYTALQNELEAAEAAKTDFETQALEHMEAIDAAKEVLAKEEAALASVEGAAPDQLADIAARRKGVEDERSGQVAEHDKIAPAIDAKLLTRFEKIRARKKPAIGVIEGKTCPVCKIALPRVRVSEIMALEGVFDCSNCKRLLAPAKAFE
jgi:predicted  nucleic acid-binding Zn-ribbon protein